MSLSRSGYIAAYWVNGAATTLPLPSGATNVELTGIAVSGSDVYSSGFWVSSSTGASVAAYWVNGVLETLPAQRHDRIQSRCGCGFDSVGSLGLRRWKVTRARGCRRLWFRPRQSRRQILHERGSPAWIAARRKVAKRAFTDFV